MLRIFLALWLAIMPAFAWAGSMTLLGVGNPPISTSYIGPGDIVSGATFWGSCARVYSAANASTSTSMCDLVDSAAPTTVICTLRGTASGKVDLVGAYCAGAVTPATKCAAATGAVCKVSKVYDQTGNSNNLSASTAATEPTLTFNALGSLPCMTSIATSVMTGGSTPSTTTGSFSTVANRTSNLTSFSGIVQAGASGPGYSNASNTGLLFQTATTATFTASNTSFHALQSTFNDPSSVAYLDGTSTSGLTAGGGNFTGGLRLFEINNGFNLLGNVCEAGFWPSILFSGGNNSSLNSNQHTLYAF